jgi:hypothetical protein
LLLPLLVFLFVIPQGSALAVACPRLHPTKIVILREGGAFAAAVEGPAVAFAVAVASEIGSDFSPDI